MKKIWITGRGCGTMACVGVRDAVAVDRADDGAGLMELRTDASP